MNPDPVNLPGRLKNILTSGPLKSQMVVWLSVYLLFTLLLTGATLLVYVLRKELFPSPGTVLAALSIEWIFITIIITAWIRRQMIRSVFQPLEKLRTGAERVGNGDLDYRIGSDRDDEVGQVGRMFDSMTERLRGREDELAARTEALARESAERERVAEELQVLNADLDHRIKERVNELSQEVAFRQRLTDRQRLLYEVLQVVSGHLDVDTVANLAANAIAKITGWPYVCLVLPDSTNRNWVMRGVGGSFSATMGKTKPIYEGVIGRVFQTRKYQLLQNSSIDPDYMRPDPVNESSDSILHSELAVPLLRGPKMIGVLNLESTAEAEFSTDDLLLAESLAEVLALALDNAGLYEEAQREIAERKRVEADLLYQSRHDFLTGLYNRTYFEQELKRLGSSGIYPVSLLMLDLDDFKQINDSLGHSTGDEILKKAAEVLKTAFPDENHIVARYGGDEFAILLPGLDETAGRLAVEQTRRCWEEAFASTSLFFTVIRTSIGCATTAPGEKLFNMLKRADSQMYAEKYKKRSRIP